VLFIAEKCSRSHALGTQTTGSQIESGGLPTDRQAYYWMHLFFIFNVRSLFHVSVSVSASVSESASVNSVRKKSSLSHFIWMRTTYGHHLARSGIKRYLGRYSTFQYPNQDPCPEDFNADAPRFSIRQTYLPIFDLLLTVHTYNCYYLHENTTHCARNVKTKKLWYPIYVPHCKGTIY